MDRRLFVAVICCLATQINCCVNQLNITISNDASVALIKTSNYPDPYSNNEHDCWVLTSVNRVHLWIPHYDFERSFDYLRIYEGQTNDGALLAEITSSGTGVSYTSNGNVMFVEFISDISMTMKGFEACACDFFVQQCTQKCSRDGNAYKWNFSNVGDLLFGLPVVVIMVILSVIYWRRGMHMRRTAVRHMRASDNMHNVNGTGTYDDARGDISPDGTQPPAPPPYQPFYSRAEYFSESEHDIQPVADMTHLPPLPVYPGPPRHSTNDHASDLPGSQEVESGHSLPQRSNLVQSSQDPPAYSNQIHQADTYSSSSFHSPPPITPPTPV